MEKTMQNVSRLLMWNNQAYLSIITEELSKFGITIPQAIVMDQVKASPKTIGEISKAIGLSYSTVSGIVDRLERNGIVVRTRDGKDRRVVWVSLIDNFHELTKKYPIFDEMYFPRLFEKMFECVTHDELELIHHALELLRSSLDRKRMPLKDMEGSE